MEVVGLVVEVCTLGHPVHLTCHPLECVFVETHERCGMSRKITNTRCARRCVLDGIATMRNNHESIRIAKCNQVTEVRYDRLTV